MSSPVPRFVPVPIPLPAPLPPSLAIPQPSPSHAEPPTAAFPASYPPLPDRIEFSPYSSSPPPASSRPVISFGFLPVLSQVSSATNHFPAANFDSYIGTVSGSLQFYIPSLNPVAVQTSALQRLKLKKFFPTRRPDKTDKQENIISSAASVGSAAASPSLPTRDVKDDRPKGRKRKARDDSTPSSTTVQPPHSFPSYQSIPPLRESDCVEFPLSTSDSAGNSSGSESNKKQKVDIITLQPAEKSAPMNPGFRTVWRFGRPRVFLAALNSVVSNMQKVDMESAEALKAERLKELKRMAIGYDYQGSIDLTPTRWKDNHSKAELIKSESLVVPTPANPQQDKIRSILRDLLADSSPQSLFTPYELHTFIDSNEKCININRVQEASARRNRIRAEREKNPSFTPPGTFSMRLKDETCELHYPAAWGKWPTRYRGGSALNSSFLHDLKPSFSLYLFQHGFSIHDSHSYQPYSRENQRFLQFIDSGLIPPGLSLIAQQSPKLLQWYEGHLIVQIFDYRMINERFRQPVVTKLLLRPTMELFWSDFIQLDPTNDSLHLQLESVLLPLLKPTLILDPSVKVHQILTYIHLNRYRSQLQPISVMESERRTLELLKFTGESEQADSLFDECQFQPAITAGTSNTELLTNSIRRALNRINLSQPVLNALAQRFSPIHRDKRLEYDGVLLTVPKPPADLADSAYPIVPSPALLAAAAFAQNATRSAMYQALNDAIEEVNVSRVPNRPTQSLALTVQSEAEKKAVHPAMRITAAREENKANPPKAYSAVYIHEMAKDRHLSIHQALPVCIPSERANPRTKGARSDEWSREPYGSASRPHHQVELITRAIPAPPSKERDPDLWQHFHSWLGTGMFEGCIKISSPADSRFIAGDEMPLRFVIGNEGEYSRFRAQFDKAMSMEQLVRLGSHKVDAGAFQDGQHHNQEDPAKSQPPGYNPAYAAAQRQPAAKHPPTGAKGKYPHTGPGMKKPSGLQLPGRMPSTAAAQQQRMPRPSGPPGPNYSLPGGQGAQPQQSQSQPHQMQGQEYGQRMPPGAHPQHHPQQQQRYPQSAAPFPAGSSGQMIPNPGQSGGQFINQAPNGQNPNPGAQGMHQQFSSVQQQQQQQQQRMMYQQQMAAQQQKNSGAAPGGRYLPNGPQQPQQAGPGSMMSPSNQQQQRFISQPGAAPQHRYPPAPGQSGDLHADGAQYPNAQSHSMGQGTMPGQGQQQGQQYMRSQMPLQPINYPQQHFQNQNHAQAQAQAQAQMQQAQAQANQRK